MNKERQQIRQFICLWKKEICHLIFSPSAIVVTLFFLLGAGISFYFNPSSLYVTAFAFRAYAGSLPVISTIALPVLSMGIWAEEKNRGTDILLYTFPVNESILITAKFLALFSMYCVILILSIPVVFTPYFVGADTVQGGPICTVYVMLILYGGAALALGQFLSFLFSNTILAFLLTCAILLMLNTIQFLPLALALPTALASLCTHLSFAWHFEAAARGVLDSRDITFYIIPTISALYANLIFLRMRKYR